MKYFENGGVLCHTHLPLNPVPFVLSMFYSLNKYCSTLTASRRLGGDGRVRRLRRDVGLPRRRPFDGRAQNDGQLPHRDFARIAKNFPEQKPLVNGKNKMML